MRVVLRRGESRKPLSGFGGMRDRVGAFGRQSWTTSMRRLLPSIAELVKSGGYDPVEEWHKTPGI
jgi:hypothetical protein